MDMAVVHHKVNNGNSVLGDHNRDMISVTDETDTPVEGIRSYRPAHICSRNPRPRSFHLAVRTIVIVVCEIAIPSEEVERLMDDLHFLIAQYLHHARVRGSVHDRIHPPVEVM